MTGPVDVSRTESWSRAAKARWEAFLDVLWSLSHPSMRRCPRCRLTWEPRGYMESMGGVCHDCFDPFAEDRDA